MTNIQTFNLVATTQGPLYPPSEVMDKNGNFVVVGNIIKNDAISWGMAIVDRNSIVPNFGSTHPYILLENLDEASEQRLAEIEMFTLPLPLPLNNYPMVFAPEQCAQASTITRPSYPLNEGYVNDYRESDGRRILPKITLNNWLKAEGTLNIIIDDEKKKRSF